MVLVGVVAAMAEYRTIRMSFWTDPYVEALPTDGKLLYLYLFTCPLTNNLGVLETTVKRIAYDTDIDVRRVSSLLSEMEKSGKLLRDGNFIWLANFIKNQCSTSPKLLQSMKELLQDIPSQKIRHALCLRYPHIFECPQDNKQDDDTISIPYPYPTDSVDIPSGEYGTRNMEDRIKNTPLPPSQGELLDGDAVEEKYPAEFEAFWSLYPRKEGKHDALKAWLKNKKKIPKLEKLKSALEWQKNSDQWQRGIIPHASTWLNGHRWQDEPPQEHQGTFESIWGDDNER